MRLVRPLLGRAFGLLGRMAARDVDRRLITNIGGDRGVDGGSFGDRWRRDHGRFVS